jgi:predicted GNAT family N-acyltransferase
MAGGFYCSVIDFATPAYDEAVKLRYDVLRKPLNIEFDPDDLAKEYDSYHIGCYSSQSDELVAVLTLKPIDNDILKMRQVAVCSDFQSHGLGSFLVTESEKFARIHRFTSIEMHARDTAIEFYKKLGYSAEGEIFKEVGIDHIFMKKDL